MRPVKSDGIAERGSARRVWPALTRCATCLILVCMVTYIAYSLLHTTALVAGFCYLRLILGVAANWGFLESTVTSIAAVLCFNFFFLPPALTIVITEPQDWVALFVFMTTASTASQLSARAQRRAMEAQTRQAEVERLYALSRSLMKLSGKEEVGAEIARLVKQCLEFRAVAFFNSLEGKMDYAGTSAGEPDAALLLEITTHTGNTFVWRQWSDTGDECFTAVVTLGKTQFGRIGALGSSISEPAWRATANLVGITMERLRSQAVASRIEAARQGESLKGLLLDALAHDFVTPLTSIKGAISTVRSGYPHEPDEDDLLAVVEEETDKLNGMVDETIDMARIESGQFRIRCRSVAPHDLIRTCLNQMSSLLDGHSTNVDVRADVPPMSADPELAALALRQLISNAVKYSPPRSKIQISGIRQSDDMVMISVRDEGPGISSDEADAIFDRYYRGSRAQGSVPGTGMGLSIARDIVRAHGGRIWVSNRPEKGAEFAFTLPVAKAEEEE
jgi:two-component system, OmpR family, sensor histidine kinase KdpD